MNQFDEHGFYTREWAEANIPGFNELGSCCQQEVLLFPELPVPCLLKREPEFVPELPLIVPTYEPQKYHGHGGAAAGGVLVGGGYPDHHSVPEPSAALLLIPLLVAVAIYRSIRGQRHA